MDYQNIYNTVKNVSFRDIIYANGKWIMTGYGGTSSNDKITWDRTCHLCTSEDLVNFTDKVFYTFPQNDNMQIPKIAYGNGIYVISLDTTYFTTSDLKNFNQKSIYSIINVNATTTVKFINGKFYMVTWTIWTNSSTGAFVRYEGHVLSSNDGNLWTNEATLSEALRDITYFNGKFYICGTRGYIAYSTNLKNWTKITSNTSSEVNSIVAGASGIIAVADNAETLYSNDGNSFKKVFLENERTAAKVAYGNGLYMQMGEDGYVAYSRNGENWSYLVKLDSGYNYGMTFSQEKQAFLIGGNAWIKTHNGALFIINISRDLAKTNDEEILYIYDLDFNFIGTIDSFKSLRWTRKYFEAGEFEIVLAADSQNLEMFKKDRLIIRNNYTESGIIETIVYKDDGSDEDLTVSGRFLSSILERRIVKSIINFNGTSIDGMKALLNQMSSFPSFEIEQTTMSSMQIQFQCSYKNIYDYLIKLAKYSGVAFRIVPNVENKVFIFENWQGNDRTSEQNENERYSFSDLEYNIDNASLTSSNKTTVNYVLVGGEGEGASRKLVEVKKGNSTGFDLYEVFVDSKSSSSQNLSTSEYENALKQDGQDAVCDPVDEFKFEVNPDDYKDKYDLGDIVDSMFSKCNYNQTNRITEVEEVIEDGKREVSITLGTSIPELWEDE